MKPAIYVFLLFAMTLAILTLLDRGFIGGAAITGGFAIAAVFTAVFAGVPGIIRSAYDAVWGVQELQLRGAQVRQAQESAGIIAYRAGQNMAISDPTGRPWQVIGPAARYAQQPEEPEPFPDPDEGALKPLLPVISGYDRLLIIGGPGAGKTSLLLHLVAGKSREGHVIVADSHAAPDSWPSDVQVTGLGRDYPEIEATIRYVCEELDRRYKLRSAGRQKHFEKLFLIIDEGFVLNQFVDVSEALKSILAEGRKVAIGIIFAGHSDRAGALALRGNKDLSSGYEKVIYLTKKDGRHLATVKDGIGDKEGEVCLHPGRWGESGSRSRGGRSGSDTDTVHRHPTPGRNARNMASEAPFDGGVGGVSGVGVYHLGYDPNAQTYVYEPEPGPQIYETRDSRTATVIRMAKAGASVSDIAKGVFGSKGGRQNGVVKRILGEFGLGG